VDRCIGCHFYDRDNSQTAAGGIRWGQCRRSAPRLHPINQKAFMIEGVWPHVRDDDWCGEWKAAPRPEARPHGDRLGAMLASGASSPTMQTGMLPARPDVRNPLGGGVLARTPAAPGTITGTAEPAAAPVRAPTLPLGSGPAAPDLGTLRPAGTAD